MQVDATVTEAGKRVQAARAALAAADTPKNRDAFLIANALLEERQSQAEAASAAADTDRRALLSEAFERHATTVSPRQFLANIEPELEELGVLAAAILKLTERIEARRIALSRAQDAMRSTAAELGVAEADDRAVRSLDVAQRAARERVSTVLNAEGSSLGRLMEWFD